MARGSALLGRDVEQCIKPFAGTTEPARNLFDDSKTDARGDDWNGRSRWTVRQDQCCGIGDRPHLRFGEPSRHHGPGRSVSIASVAPQHASEPRA